MRAVILGLVAVTQSGCVGGLIYAEARKVTRAGVAAAVPAALPDRPAAPAAACVFRGLTQAEIVSLPNSGTFDDPARAQTFVRGVAARPDVAACLAALPVAG